jgi:tripartite-type tricarboxylate transporter receptor subunit TctC
MTTFLSSRTHALSPLSRLARHIAIGVVASLAMAGGASAYPDKPISLLVPFAPGGSSDTIARTIGPELAKRLNQTVVVENVAGAGGMIATQRTVKSAPDGYTVLLGSGSEILINKLINPKIEYDGIRDLDPVVFVGTGPMVLVGRPGLKATTLSELLAEARSNPKGLSYASAGNGTPMHVAGELMNIRAGLTMTHVPYRGAAPALVDLMGDQVDLGISTYIAAKPHIDSGKIRLYGLTTAEPSDLAPTVPAMGQHPDLKGFDLGVWFGLFVPKGTPADIVQKIQTASQAVLADPAIRNRLATLGISASGESADALRRFMANEVVKYKEVIETAKIKAE